MGVDSRHFLPFFIGGKTLCIHPCPGSPSWVVTCFISFTLQKLNLQPHCRLGAQEPYGYSPSHSFVSLFHSSFKKDNLFLPLFLEISFYVYLSIYLHTFILYMYIFIVYIFIYFIFSLALLFVWNRGTEYEFNTPSPQKV